MDPHKDHDKDDAKKDIEKADKETAKQMKDNPDQKEAGKTDAAGSYQPGPGEPKKGPAELRPRTDLPAYKVEKEVHAAKITEISHPGHNNATELKLEGGATVVVSSDYIAEHEPEVGGYYVQDAKGDNYASAEDFGSFKRL